MKRKRQSDGAEAVQETQNGVASSDTGLKPSFDTFGLDARLLQGISQVKFTSPTPVQAQAIPPALDGRNILARARTGSGKTAAYVLPILEKTLRRAQQPGTRPATTSLVLVPTRELAEQVERVVHSLCVYCGRDVRTVNLAQRTSDAVQKTFLADRPDVVIATPARIAFHAENGNLDLSELSTLVVDEADLVLSYGNEKDVRFIAERIPRGVQCLLMSATLTSDVETLQGLVCQDPVVLNLDEQNDKQRLTQYIVKCSEDEKFLLLYIIFKLKLVKGKTIIFVDNIDRCYRVKLYLEQFGIRSCVLNSELPVNSRIHIVDEFNKNVYDIIIASDETEIVGSAGESGETNGTADSTKLKPKKEPKRKRDKNYGVSRGIDFQAVSYVLNFDLPTSSTSYTHRIGRTARANNTGTALSFVVPKAQHGKHKATSIPSTLNDEAVLSSIEQSQKTLGRDLKPYNFDPAAINPFRYRTSDALRAVTSVAVRDARAKELRRQLLASEKLKQHFAEHPEDEQALRMDGELHTARVQSHLKHVPTYLLQNATGVASATVSNGESTNGTMGNGVGFAKLGLGSGRRAKARERMGLKHRLKAKGGSKKVDVLKSFKAKKRS